MPRDRTEAIGGELNGKNGRATEKRGKRRNAERWSPSIHNEHPKISLSDGNREVLVKTWFLLYVVPTLASGSSSLVKLMAIPDVLSTPSHFVICTIDTMDHYKQYVTSIKH